MFAANPKAPPMIKINLLVLSICLCSMKEARPLDEKILPPSSHKTT